MPSNYDHQENLRSTLKSYRKAKAKHEREVAEQKKKHIRWLLSAVFVFAVCSVFVVSWLRRDNVFLEICKTGTPEEVKAAIARNIWNVNMKVYEGYGYDSRTISPYILAAEKNHNPEVLRVLEQAGAKADKNEALRRAMYSGNQEVVKFLVQNGANNEDNALNDALRKFAERNNVEMVKFLVQNGADNKDYALEEFAERDNIEMVKFLIQNGADKDNALGVFASRGDMEMVKFLLQNGATDKNNALGRAAYAGKMEMVKFLLQNGATDKNNALESAMRGGESEIAKFLIQSGAKVNDVYELWSGYSRSRRVIAEIYPQALLSM